MRSLQKRVGECRSTGSPPALLSRVSGGRGLLLRDMFHLTPSLLAPPPPPALPWEAAGPAQSRPCARAGCGPRRVQR